MVEVIEATKERAVDVEKMVRIEGLKKEALVKLQEAEKAWYALACETPVGPERERAFDVYEKVRTATRLW